jgi:hypothetical protein
MIFWSRGLRCHIGLQRTDLFNVGLDVIGDNRRRLKSSFGLLGDFLLDLGIDCIYNTSVSL